MVLQKSQLCSINSVGATSVIYPIAWLTKSYFVAPAADCRREEGSPSMLKGGTVGDGKSRDSKMWLGNKS